MKKRVEEDSPWMFPWPVTQPLSSGMSTMQGALLQPQIQRHVQKYLKQLRCSSKSLVPMSIDKRREK